MQTAELNWTKITFPMTLKDINRFECQNPAISVNVFGYENYKSNVYTLRISNHKKETVVNLLLISDDEQQHYC
jgi:hypothetical protein